MISLMHAEMKGRSHVIRNDLKWLLVSRITDNYLNQIAAEPFAKWTKLNLPDFFMLNPEADTMINYT